MNASVRPDAIVIGGGIVGAACAAALARDGARVTVVEGSFVGGGTTAAGMGHLVVMDDSPAQFALTAYSQRLWAELAPELDRRCELDPCGTLWIAEDDLQMDAVRAKQAMYARAGISTDVLDSRQLAEAEPELRLGLAGALLVPSDGVLYPPGAALRLIEIARSHGATLRERAEVIRIAPNAVCVAGETLRADVVVNAAGAGAARLTPELPIVPRKGHLAITDRYPGFCRHQLVELGYLVSAHVMSDESVAFNVQPRATGQVLIGSSRELGGWSGGINERVLGRMLQRATEFMPRLAGLSVVRCWAGFRPATPDKLPLIGRWAPTPGLWIATGHEGLGITASLGTGQMLADMIAGRPPAIDPGPFAPTRVLVTAGATS
ncbi:MAG TPA: FAD-dependent oxidoreductase [Gemmatimonadaceae bacterium]